MARGHIRQRPSGSWEAVAYLGRDPSGRRRYLFRSFPTRREAQEWLASTLADPPAAPTRMTFQELAGQWLASRSLAPKTIRDYEWVMRRHLLPEFGPLRLQRISPAHVATWLSRLRERSGPATARYAFSVLRAVFRTAVRWGLLRRSPTEAMPPPRSSALAAPQVWDEEQVRMFLATAARHSALYPLYLLAITTGLRQGELLGLRWEDVDLATGAVVVRRALQRLPGGRILLKEPKSSMARRTVDLPPVCLDVLRQLQAAQRRLRSTLKPCTAGLDCRDASCPDWHDLNLVLCQPNGKPLHAHNITRRDFARLIRRTGLPRIRFHDLRHVHASLLISSGIHPKVLQERLGHSSASFTLQVYGHLFRGLQGEAARRLDLRVPEWTAQDKWSTIGEGDDDEEA